MEKIKLGIAGLGLIGASILKCLSTNKNYEIYTYSNSVYKKALNYTPNSSDNIEILKNCDIIFVSCEISKTLDTLKKLDAFLNKNTIVADCASTKKQLLGQKFNYNFILSHPMAGSEKSGFDALDADLFQGAKWLIEKNNPILNKVIEDLGAKPFLIDMTNHDYMCAQISHLPALLSFLLFDSATDDSKKIASSGFKDTTRLAMTNSQLMLGMLKNNEKNILIAFDELLKKFEHLKKLSDNEKINLFNEISKKRSLMYDNNGKNIL